MELYNRHRGTLTINSFQIPRMMSANHANRAAKNLGDRKAGRGRLAKWYSDQGRRCIRKLFPTINNKTTEYLLFPVGQNVGHVFRAFDVSVVVWKTLKQRTAASIQEPEVPEAPEV